MRKMKMWAALVLTGVMLAATACGGGSSAPATTAAATEKAAEAETTKAAETEKAEETEAEEKAEAEETKAAATGDEGKYMVFEYESNGNKVNHDTLVASGMGDTYLWLKPGGEAELYLFNQSIDATWKPGVVTTYGTADYTYELDGDTLTLDMAGVTYIMKRDDAAVLTASSGGSQTASGTYPAGIYYTTFLGDMSIQEFAGLMGGTVEEYCEIMKFELKEDGTMVFYGDGKAEEGTWTLEGDVLTIEADGETMTGILDGDTLTIDLEGETLIMSTNKPVDDGTAVTTGKDEGESEAESAGDLIVPDGVPNGDGLMSEEEIQKGYVWMNKVAKDIWHTSYEELAEHFGVEGAFDYEEYSDHMGYNKRYYKWISTEDEDHFIYVNFGDVNHDDVYVVTGFNSSGFSSADAEAKYLDIVQAEESEAGKAAAANMAMKDFTVDAAPGNDYNVKVSMQIPESGWAWDEARRHLVENEDIYAFGVGFIQIKADDKVEDFDFYKADFENYKDIDDREIDGVTFKGRTYKSIGYDWTEYIAQIDDGRAVSIGVVRVDISDGSMGDKIINSMKFQ